MRAGLDFRSDESGVWPVITCQDKCGKWRAFLEVIQPLQLFLKEYGNCRSKSRVGKEKYQTISIEDSRIRAEGQIDAPDGSSYRFNDIWYYAEEGCLQVDRKIAMLKKGKSEGVRFLLTVATTDKDTSFHDFQYLIPPVFYKHNDLDYDGIPDYFESFEQSYREDALTAPTVMAYTEEENLYIALLRVNTPAFDSKLDRSALDPSPGENSFLQETDVGSIGMRWDKAQDRSQMVFQAYYPFYEGKRSVILNFTDKPNCGAFWPMKIGQNAQICLSYQIRVHEADSYSGAVWNLFKYLMSLYQPRPVELLFSLQEASKYRINFLERCYRKWTKSEDSAEPAGFLVNVHPKEGKILSNTIDYGYTGRNTDNAYAMLRHGYMNNQKTLVDKAIEVINFAVRCQHPSGIYYDFYNVEKHAYDFWWYGYLLPLNYAKSKEELRAIIGAVPDRIAPITDSLQKTKGSYLRTTSEHGHGIILSYLTEKKHGIEHADWLKSAIKCGDFLLSLQGRDGSWDRAYNLEGQEVTQPEAVFGKNEQQRKGNTATAIPFLLKLLEATNENKYLKAAVRAGDFVLKNYMEKAEYCGGIMDAVWLIEGLTYDDEGIGYPLEALLELYLATKEDRFLKGAIIAGIFHCTWIYLWDVPLPEGSTLARYKFKSTGWGQGMSPTSGYVHPYPLMIVEELIKLTELTGDRGFFEIAKLVQFNEQQALATPKGMYGYKEIGIQEEGYLLSQRWIDDIDLRAEFGHGDKGEGNKTCLGWVYTVALGGALKILDEYGTLDFDLIEKKIFQEVNGKIKAP